MSNNLKRFRAEVVDRSHQIPVVVDFWAPWCGPCKTLGPVLDKLAQEAQGRWELVKINTEEMPDLAEQFEIRSIPSVKLFYRGHVVDEFLGALPEPAIQSWLAKALPSPQDAEVARAARHVNDGSLAEAIALLEPVIEKEPNHCEARLLLAQCYLGSKPNQVLDVLRPIPPEANEAGKAQALCVLAGVALAAHHPERLPEGPEREGYLRGAESLRSGDYAGALKAFIEVMQQNRNYHNASATEACKAIFQFLGIRHPICDRYYRAFSSTLHS